MQICFSVNIDWRPVFQFYNALVCTSFSQQKRAPSAMPFICHTKRLMYMQKEEKWHKQPDVTWQHCWLNTHLLLCPILMVQWIHPTVEYPTSCMTELYNSHRTRYEWQSSLLLSTPGFFFFFICSSKDCWSKCDLELPPLCSCFHFQ